MLTSVLMLLAVLQPLESIPQPTVIDRGTPLTNTRYAAQSGVPLLASNGTDILLFWATPDNIRVTREGEHDSSGRPVLATNGHAAAGVEHDVVWTGSDFLVAATRRNADGTTSIVGRRLDANGDPLGAEFTVLPNAREPRLAFNATNFVMSYRLASGDVTTRRLSRAGLPLSEPPAFVLDADIHDAAGNGANVLVLTLERDHLGFTPIDASGVSRTTQRLAGNLSTMSSTRAAALAAGGDGFFAVWRDVRSQLNGTILDANGDTQSVLTLDRQISTGIVSVAPTSDGYAVVYSSTNEVRMVRVSRDGAIVRSVLHPMLSPFVSVASAGTKSRAAWTDSDGSIRLSGDTGALSFGANRQLLDATASSGDSILAMWRERDSLRAGVRTRSGEWSEHEIATGATGIAAAAGGGQFVVVVEKSGPRYAAIRLSGTGEPLGETIIPAFAPQSIAWNGQGFAVAGVGLDITQRFPTQSVAAALLSPSGTLSTASFVTSALPVGRPLETAIASDGSGYLLAWRAFSAGGCVIPCPFDPESKNVAAIRLRGDLTRADTALHEIANVISTASYLSGVAWDGSEYVVVWTEQNALKSRTVPLSGAMGVTFTLGARKVTESRVASIAGGVAITWREQETDYAIVPGRTPRKLLWNGPVTTRTQAVAFGGGIAYLTSAVQDAPPYYGASRVMMSIDDNGLPPRPNMPFLTARLLPGGRAQLTWSAPPQPVSGYRVETRRAGGTWSEVEAWISGDDRTLSVPLPANGTHTFRVRAWNDSGVSEYSNEVSISNGGRRRAVR